jgi:hypothetical protein
LAQYTFATGDTLTASQVNELGKSPVSADVTTAQTTTSTGYTDLSTVGPSVTMTLNAGTVVAVTVSASISVTTTPDEAYMSWQCTGASGTQAASDANAAWGRFSGGNAYTTLSRRSLYTASTTGSHTFTAKYRFADGGGSSAARFEFRRIIVEPRF